MKCLRTFLHPSSQRPLMPILQRGVLTEDTTRVDERKSIKRARVVRDVIWCSEPITRFAKTLGC